MSSYPLHLLNPKVKIAQHIDYLTKNTDVKTSKPDVKTFVALTILNAWGTVYYTTVACAAANARFVDKSLNTIFDLSKKIVAPLPLSECVKELLCANLFLPHTFPAFIAYAVGYHLLSFSICILELAAIIFAVATKEYYASFPLLNSKGKLIKSDALPAMKPLKTAARSFSMIFTLLHHQTSDHLINSLFNRKLVKIDTSKFYGRHFQRSWKLGAWDATFAAATDKQAVARKFMQRYFSSYCGFNFREGWNYLQEKLGDQCKTFVPPQVCLENVSFMARAQGPSDLFNACIKHVGYKLFLHNSTIDWNSWRSIAFPETGLNELSHQIIDSIVQKGCEDEKERFFAKLAPRYIVQFPDKQFIEYYILNAPKSLKTFLLTKTKPNDLLELALGEKAIWLFCKDDQDLFAALQTKDFKFTPPFYPICFETLKLMLKALPEKHIYLISHLAVRKFGNVLLSSIDTLPTKSLLLFLKKEQLHFFEEFMRQSMDVAIGLADPTNNQNMKKFIALMGEHFFSLLPFKTWDLTHAELTHWFLNIHSISPSTFEKLLCDKFYVNRLATLATDWKQSVEKDDRLERLKFDEYPELLKVLSMSHNGPRVLIEMKLLGRLPSKLSLDHLTKLELEPGTHSTFNLDEYRRAAPNIREIHFSSFFPNHIDKLMNFTVTNRSNLQLCIDPFLPGMSTHWNGHVDYSDGLLYPVVNQFRFIDRWRDPSIKDRIVFDEKKFPPETIKEWWSFGLTGCCSAGAFFEIMTYLKECHCKHANYFQPLRFEAVQAEAIDSLSGVAVGCVDEDGETLVDKHGVPIPPLHAHRAVLSSASLMMRIMLTFAVDTATTTFNVQISPKALKITFKMMYQDHDILQDLKAASNKEAIGVLFDLFCLAEYLDLKDTSWKARLEDELILRLDNVLKDPHYQKHDQEKQCINDLLEIYQAYSTELTRLKENLDYYGIDVPN